MTAFGFWGTIDAVPLYVYRCETCGSEFEELQKSGADAPEQPSDLADCKKSDEAADAPCNLVRQLTTAGHRFTAENSSDGLGGFTRQGDTILRQLPGKNSTRYGSDRSGRD